MKKDLARLGKTNRKLAKERWPNDLGTHQLQALKHLTESYGFAIALGDLLLLERKWYVTHAGLLRLAERNRCQGIHVHQVRSFCDPTVVRWAFKATVYKNTSSKGFVGYGDADPSNVSTLMHGAEMRIAETRAVNRALRKAYGIGLCSVEELGSISRELASSKDHEPSAEPHARNGTSNGQPRLRDQLCLLIRQHNLDPNLVKAYAADFCGTASLKDARRELVESFIKQLATSAKENRDVLMAKLTSYAQHEEVRP
jgi:hypothetical protein